MDYRSAAERTRHASEKARTSAYSVDALNRAIEALPRSGVPGRVAFALAGLFRMHAAVPGSITSDLLAVAEEIIAADTAAGA